VSALFTVHCPRHDATVLIWPSGIDGITNVDGRIEVHYHCTCGHRGTWITGRGATRPATREPDPVGSASSSSAV
jgi:hypothetical protein